jgi:hypothetical protein
MKHTKTLSIAAMSAVAMLVYAPPVATRSRRHRPHRRRLQRAWRRTPWGRWIHAAGSARLRRTRGLDLAVRRQDVEWLVRR